MFWDYPSLKTKFVEQDVAFAHGAMGHRIDSSGWTH